MTVAASEGKDRDNPSFSAKKTGASGALILFANKALTVLLGVLLARGLGVDGYGVYAYAYSVMGLLAIVAQWGMPTLLMREVSRTVALGRWDRLNGALLGGPAVVLGLSIMLAALAGLVSWLAAVPAEREQRAAIYLILLLLPLSATFQVQCNVLAGLHSATLGFLYNLVLAPAVALIALFGVFILAPDILTPLSALWVQIATFLVMLLVVTATIQRRKPSGARAAAAAIEPLSWLRKAVPFVLIGTAMVLNTKTDIIMLGWFNQAADVGIYSVAAQGALVVSLGIQAVNNAFSPRFSRLYAQGDLRELRALFRLGQAASFAGALVSLAVLYFFGKPLLSYIFGSDFALSYAPLVILALGYVGNAAFGPIGALATMTGKESATAWILWAVALANVALNLALIPAFGSIGAAAATAVTVSGYHLILYIIVWTKMADATAQTQ